MAQIGDHDIAPPVDLTKLRHIGIVVPDLEAAMEEISHLARSEWSEARTSSRRLRTSEGVIQPSIRYAYLQRPEGGELIEVVQAVPGTIWAHNPATAAHHIAVWVDDLAAASQLLEAQGAPLVSTGETADGEPNGNAYHKLRCGLYVELTPRTG